MTALAFIVPLASIDRHHLALRMSARGTFQV